MHSIMIYSTCNESLLKSFAIYNIDMHTYKDKVLITIGPTVSFFCIHDLKSTQAISYSD